MIPVIPFRQRQRFDVCAATFGTDYFFSLWEAEIPAVVDGRAAVAMLLDLYLLFMISFQLCGLFFGSFVFLVLLLSGF